jgi:glycosyltransferase involved in cell wall biosynthesis
LNCYTLRFPENRGKGTAILAAADYASKNRYDAILTIDADGQHDPREAEKLVAEAGKGKWPAIIIGARQMVQDTVPDSSRFGRRFSNFWVRLETGRDLSDTQSGMRLYPVREMLQLSLKRKRYDFEIEVLVKGIWAGLDVRSVDVSVHYPAAGERISHFDKIVDNWRLTRIHGWLVLRRLLPLPDRRLVKKEIESEEKFSARPWQVLKKICRENSSPFWLAVAVWVGIFLGALPLIACHTVVIIYVAHRYHLNKIAAVAASQFCMPPLIPALCIETGYYFRKGHFLFDLSHEKWLFEIHHRIWDWLLGSLVVGPVFGMIGAVVIYFSARSFKGGKRDFD